MERRDGVSRVANACWIGMLLWSCGSSHVSPSFGSGLASVPASDAIRAQEHRMFTLLNRDREQAGRKALKYDERLADVARYHSKDMRDNGFFEHESKTSGSLEDRLNAAAYLFLAARENLSEAPDVEQSQANLMNSPPHRANILSTDVTHVGVGIVEGGVRDPRNLTVTQVFARPGRQETAEQARAAIVHRFRDARQAQGLPALKNHATLQKLAEEWVEELGPDASEQRVKHVGEQVSQALAVERPKDINGVLTGGQLLPDSEALRIPAPLLTKQAHSFGVAVRQVKGPAERPMLAVLLLVGLR